MRVIQWRKRSTLRSKKMATTKKGYYQEIKYVNQKPLVLSDNIVVPSHHIKLWLMKNFVKAMNTE